MPDEDGYSLIAKVRALGKERGGEGSGGGGTHSLRGRKRSHPGASIGLPDTCAEAD